MTEMINIQDDVCWRCGKEFDQNDPELCRTTHHVLPRHLQPFKNIVVPIHKKCHDEITASDKSTLTAFAYKIIRDTKKLQGQVDALNSLISTRDMIKFKTQVKK